MSNPTSAASGRARRAGWRAARWNRRVALAAVPPARRGRAHAGPRPERRAGARARQRRRTGRPARLHARRRPPPPGPPVPRRRHRSQARRPAGAGAGRPARRYVLSSQGQSTLGDDYLDIASLALKQLEEMAGADAVRKFAVERFAEMERRYAPEIDAAGPDITARAQALSAALSRDGFVASAASIEAKAPLPAALSSVQLCQGHCPIQQLASTVPGFLRRGNRSVFPAGRRRRAPALHAGARRARLHHPHTYRPSGRQRGRTAPEPPRTAWTKYPTICKKGRDDGPTIREDGC